MTSAAATDALAPPAPTSDARTRLERFLGRPHGLVRMDPARVAVEPLVQEAGERVYFRVRPAAPAPGWAGDGEWPTLVLCVMAQPYAPGTLPFANSTELYRELGVPAPGIIEEAPEIGVLALEDLGDDLLQTIAQRGGSDLAPLYDEAVEIVVRIQREGARIGRSPEAGRFGAFSNRLDAPLFLKELRFFARHFLGDFAGVRMTGSAARELDARFAALAEEAAGGPQALAHRDFHSRNLIACRRSSDAGRSTPERLHVIDHQDSRIGPRSYDLMSLVRDPYVAGDGGSGMPFREPDLVTRFRDAAGLRSVTGGLRSEFDAVALQRNLKALGTYGFQVSVRENDVYRRYVPPTLTMVRENLDRHHDRADRRILETFLTDIPDDFP